MGNTTINRVRKRCVMLGILINHDVAVKDEVLMIISVRGARLVSFLIWGNIHVSRKLLT